MKGIGIDMVQISQMGNYIQRFGEVFIRRTFTAAEVACFTTAAHPAEYLATRFAAKEAVFKALAHLTSRKGFDYRIVETLNDTDGAPYVNITPNLQKVMQDAGVESLLVAMTTEADIATVIVVAE